MSRRIDRSWVVIDSLEPPTGDFCVDLFRRPDDSWGFEHFRRDVEDAGAWTPIGWNIDRVFATREAATEAAMRAVGWLAEAVARRPR